MNNHRDPRIRALVVELAESSGSPPDFVDIEDHAGVSTVSRLNAPRRYQRAWIAVATAIGVLILVGSIGLLVRTGTQDPSITTQPPPPTTTQPPALDLLALEWSRSPGRLADGGMVDVTAGGPGLVAVGADFERDSSNAAVWTSSDGVEWSRVPHDEAIFGAADVSIMDGEAITVMSGVTAGGPGLVAVGFAGPGLERNAAVWTSPDGLQWTRVPHDEEVFGQSVMRDVTAGGPGLVAVGRSDLDGTSAAAWTSTDGLTWSRVPDEVGTVGVGTVELATVITGGPGLVAIGTAVLTSPDGVEWTQAVGLGSNHEIADVAVGGPGLVAVGQIDDPSPPDKPSPGEQAAVWISIDGSSWSRVPHDEAIFGTETSVYMRSVAAIGSDLVAVGSINGNAAVWVSADGLAWTRVPYDEAVFALGSMESLTPWRSGLVAVGDSNQWIAIQN